MRVCALMAVTQWGELHAGRREVTAEVGETLFTDCLTVRAIVSGWARGFSGGC